MASAVSVDFSDGASHPADKGETFALRLVRGGELTLSVGDGQRYARYGQRVDSIVMLSNTGESGSEVSVQFSLSAGFDASRAQLDCFGAGAGATCVQDAVDPLRFAVTLPPDVAGDVPRDRPVRVIVLVQEEEDERSWAAITAEQFAAGYDDGDAIYDALPAR